MKIDEAAFAKVVAAVKENFGLAIEMDEYDWEEATRDILAALPPAEPGRDRIAVVTTSGNLAAAQVLYRGSEVSEYTWQCLEAKVGSNWGLARAIIRCNLPRSAEPVEVEGSVEYPGIMSGPEPEGTKTWEQDMWGTIKP